MTEIHTPELLEVNEIAFINSANVMNAELFTLRNKNGIVVQITNYGGKIVSILVPDREGKMADIVLGYESIVEYINGNPYFGAVCGRYANRIANGKFIIEKNEYQLPINNGPNHLHGGPEGFNNKVFKLINYSSASQSLYLSYYSKDGEMGYPGNLVLNIWYSLTDDNELRIDFEAVTDKATHVNICFHSFFNLAGEGNGDILDHELYINAHKYTPVNKDLVPTGEMLSVKDTPMDFTKPVSIGKRIDADYDQLIYGCGYDHNWVLNKKPNELALASTCYEPKSGRVLK